jgi:hypothetical protein
MTDPLADSHVYETPAQDSPTVARCSLVEPNISMSLDGFVTGPDLNRYPGLGGGGDVLHAWVEEDRAAVFAPQVPFKAGSPRSRCRRANLAGV